MAELIHIYVSYNDGNINIHRGENIMNIPINNFKVFDKDTYRPIGSDNEFVEQQTMIRLVDILKDSKIFPAIPNDQVCQIMEKEVNACSNHELTLATYKRSFPYTEQATLIWTEEIETEVKHNGDDLSSYKNRVRKYITNNTRFFKESGLSASSILETTPTYVHNFGNQVVDPLGRAAPTNRDILFQSMGETLHLDESFMSLFGIDGCTITCTRINDINFEYSIRLDGIEITDTNNRTEQAPLGISYFAGNSEKNKYITTSPFIDVTTSKALLITKELGDLLQVLLAFIYTKINDVSDYMITTGDEVVLLTASILGLNCLSTRKWTDKIYNGSSVKKCALQIFKEEVDHLVYTNNLKHMQLIHTENATYIQSLNTLLGGGDRRIDITNGSNKYTVDVRFITDIIADCTTITNHLGQAMVEIMSKYQGLAESTNKNSAEAMNMTNDVGEIENHYKLIPVIDVGSKRVPTCVYRYTNNTSLFRKDLKLFKDEDRSVVQFLNTYGKMYSPIRIPSQQEKAAMDAAHRRAREEQNKKTAAADARSHRLAMRSQPVVIATNNRSRSRGRNMSEPPRNRSKSPPRRSGGGADGLPQHPFQPILFSYKLDDMNGVGEELEKYNWYYSTETLRDNVRTVDIHALFRDQVRAHLTRVYAHLLPLYEYDIFTLLYREFHYNRYSVFGEDLQRLVDRIIKKEIQSAYEYQEKENQIFLQRMNIKPIITTTHSIPNAIINNKRVKPWIHHVPIESHSVAKVSVHGGKRTHKHRYISRTRYSRYPKKTHKRVKRRFTQRKMRR